MATQGGWGTGRTARERSPGLWDGVGGAQHMGWAPLGAGGAGRRHPPAETHPGKGTGVNKLSTTKGVAVIGYEWLPPDPHCQIANPILETRPTPLGPRGRGPWYLQHAANRRNRCHFLGASPTWRGRRSVRLGSPAYLGNS